MDNADRAKILEQQHRGIAIDNARKQEQLPEQILKVKNRECIDCDAKINEKRLKIFPFALRCVGCQEVHEKKKKRYA